MKIRYDTVQYDTIQYDTMRCNTIQYDNDAIQYDRRTRRRPPPLRTTNRWHKLGGPTEYNLVLTHKIKEADTPQSKKNERK